MNTEIISVAEILDNKEMHLKLASGGHPLYEQIYREGKEVYWNHQLGSFKSPAPRQWSYSRWFHHIVEVASLCGIRLELSEHTQWRNVSEATRKAVLSGTIG